jgi:hypothetical protein
MPPPHDWTESEHALIRARRPHTSWDDIARELGIARWTVIDHAKRVGLWTSDQKPLPETTEPNRERWPMPAGHETSWSAITAGTVLEGARYD